MNWQVWLKGLMSGAIGAAANASVATVADPQHFNFSSGGLEALARMAAGGAIIAVLSYLKQSPLPNGQKENK